MCRSPSRASQSFSHSLRCRDGSTPLKVAINCNKADVVAYLRCSSGSTPLKGAIIKNKADVVAYLRGIGAPE